MRIRLWVTRLDAPGATAANANAANATAAKTTAANASAAFAAAVLAIAVIAFVAPAARAAAQPSVLAPPPLVDPAAGSADGSAGAAARLAAAATAGAPFVHQVVEIVNEERLAVGKPPLKAVDLLHSSAGGHSSRMATGDFFAHCDLDTKATFGSRILATGYVFDVAGENIAAGSSTPEAVIALWMGSPPHRNNILGIAADYREIGVGYVAQAGDGANVRQDLEPALSPDCNADSFDHGPYVHYWTQNFGRRNTVYPVIVEREAWETSCAEVDLYTYGAGELAEMRFSNDQVDWSDWMPFASEVEWTLDPQASGTATVFSELRNGGTLRSASDMIELADDYPAVSSLDLSMETVVGVESWTACDTIAAGDGFEIAASGEATFTAPRVILENGFSVATGGELRVVTP